jgi:hypothetical protein
MTTIEQQSDPEFDETNHRAHRDSSISDRTVAGQRQITVAVPDGRILGPVLADPASSAAEIAENLVAADASESVAPPPSEPPPAAAPAQHA